MQKVIFKTQVVSIGEEALDFSSINMLIFFGENAPSALKPSCFLIRVSPTSMPITTGMRLQIDNQGYVITAVGSEINDNLNKLGHIAVRFTGEKEADLPGSLYVEKKDFPIISKGTVVQIVSN